MSIAYFAHPSLLTPLQSLFRWFVSGASPSQRPSEDCPKVTANAANFAADFADSKGTISLNHPQAGPVQPSRSSTRVSRPLNRMVRVSRLVEEGLAPAHVGRMVISGRMDDVCAELDRLVLREATLH